jgi:ryanodine receptor 2
MHGVNSVKCVITLSHFLVSDVMAKMEASMPTLEAVLTEVDQFTESEKTYADAPHIIDVILPLLCSYLPFWWSQGPDNVSPTGG